MNNRQIDQAFLKRFDDEVKQYTNGGESLPKAIDIVSRKYGLNPYQMQDRYYTDVNTSDKPSYNDIKTKEGSFVVLKDDPNKTQYEVININNKDAIVLRNSDTNEEIKASETELTPVVTENMMNKIDEAQYNVSINGLETTDANALAQMLNYASQVDNGSNMGEITPEPMPMDMNNGLPMDMNNGLPMDMNNGSESFGIDDDVPFDEELPAETDMNTITPSVEQSFEISSEPSLDNGLDSTISDDLNNDVINDENAETMVEPSVESDMGDENMDFDDELSEVFKSAGVEVKEADGYDEIDALKAHLGGSRSLIGSMNDLIYRNYKAPKQDDIRTVEHFREILENLSKTNSNVGELLDYFNSLNTNQQQMVRNFFNNWPKDSQLVKKLTTMDINGYIEDRKAGHLKYGTDKYLDKKPTLSRRLKDKFGFSKSEVDESINEADDSGFEGYRLSDEEKAKIERDREEFKKSPKAGQRPFPRKGKESYNEKVEVKEADEGQGMTIEQVYNLIKSLASSMGSYGRLLRALDNADEEERNEWLSQFTNCKNDVDVILKLEGGDLDESCSNVNEAKTVVPANDLDNGQKKGEQEQFAEEITENEVNDAINAGQDVSFDDSDVNEAEEIIPANDLEGNRDLDFDTAKEQAYELWQERGAGENDLMSACEDVAAEFDDIDATELCQAINDDENRDASDDYDFDAEIDEVLKSAGVKLEEDKLAPRVVDYKANAKKADKKPQEPNYKEVDTDIFGKEASEGAKCSICCEAVVNKDKIKAIYETAKSMYAKKDVSEWGSLDRRYIEKLIKEGCSYGTSSKMIMEAKKGK